MMICNSCRKDRAAHVGPTELCPGSKSKTFLADGQYADVPDCDVVVGDLVLGWSYRSDPTDFFLAFGQDERGGYRVTEITPAGRICHKNGGVHTVGQANVALMRVLLPRPGGAVIPAAAAASDRWNGRCPACGRGVYTGLLRTEHEGGECR